MKSIFVAIIILTGLWWASSTDTDCLSGHAIQILTPENHPFNLELNILKQVLEADEIKDRNVVVVGITGAFRKGKSFLLNFLSGFYAQR